MQNNQQQGTFEGASSVDHDEIAKFSAMADAWWDPNGAFKPLHAITPLRIDYIRRHACAHFNRDAAMPTPLAGLTVLDIGCGGGLASEPMARLGAQVKGIDASGKNIAIASSHAQQQALAIDYQNTTAEEVAATGQTYDLVIALEIIEHVADVHLFLETLASLTAPGGMLVITTLNRTLKSLLMAKIGAEYVLRWLPIGTHDWHKFLRPSEIILPLQQHGMVQRDLSGMVYHPLTRDWSLDADDISVNYLVCLTRP